MLGRIAACGAAAMALAAFLIPSQAWAKSLGISPPHTGSIAAHVHHHARHHHRGAYRNGYPGYGYGYSYVFLGDASDDVRDRVIPLAYPVYAGPRCVHSVDFVKVPAELGGERVIRITRC